MKRASSLFQTQSGGKHALDSILTTITSYQQTLAVAPNYQSLNLHMSQACSNHNLSRQSTNPQNRSPDFAIVPHGPLSNVASRKSPRGIRRKASAVTRSVSNVHVNSDVAGAPAELATTGQKIDSPVNNHEVKGQRTAGIPSSSPPIRGEGGGSDVKVEREFLDFGKRVRYYQ